MSDVTGYRGNTPGGVIVTGAQIQDGAVGWSDLSSTVQTLVGQGFRNLLINAAGFINQRGYVSGTATAVANQYTLDRWRVVTSGQNLVFAATGNGYTMTAPAGGVEQVIEGGNIFGGTYCLNWQGTATATVNGNAVAKGGTFTLLANTNATVRFIGGTFYQPQLEYGSTPSLYEQRPFGFEPWLAQRYFCNGVDLVMTSTYAAGTAITSPIRFQNTMRTSPTMTISPSSFSGVGYNATNSVVSNARQFALAFTTSNGANSTGLGTLTWTANAEL